MKDFEITEKMAVNGLGSEELKIIADFKGFGVDGSESRLDFVKRFNNLLWNYLTVCTDTEDKLLVAKKVSRELNLLLDSSDDNLPTEIRVLRASAEVHNKYEEMVKREYREFMDTLDEEQLTEILDDVSSVLEEFDEDDFINRYYWILTSGREFLGIDTFSDDFIE